MKQVKFTRGQCIFKEGVYKTDGIYFVKDGEFQVTMNKKTNNTRMEDRPALKVL